jgi:hypothetical protein
MANTYTQIHRAVETLRPAARPTIHFPTPGARLDAAPMELLLYRGGLRDYKDFAPTGRVSGPVKCPNSREAQERVPDGSMPGLNASFCGFHKNPETPRTKCICT